MAFLFGPMFFSAFRGFNTSQAFEELLSKEDTTLEQLLEDEDVIQETRNSNAKLLDFLDTDKIEQMILYITEEPTDPSDTNRCYKFPFVVSEMLSCEIPILLDRIVSSEWLLANLFSLFSEPTNESVNLTLAGYVVKTVQTLLQKNKEWMAKYILSKEENDHSGNLVRHMYSTSVAELIGKLIALDEQAYEPLLINERVVLLDAVLAKLSGDGVYDEINNATELLVDLVQRSEGTNGWSILMARILSQESLTKMFSSLSSGNIYAIKGVVTLLNAILQHSNFAVIANYSYEKLLAGESQEQEKDDEVLLEEENPAVIEALIANLPQMAGILKTNGDREIPMTYGASIVPLGEMRLRIIELITQVIRIDLDGINKQILESEILQILTNLFFEYIWNSQFQYYYDIIIQKVLNGDVGYLKNCLISSAKLPERLIETWRDADAIAGGRPYRKGNLGYVTRLANALVKYQSGESDPIQLCEGWEDFVDIDLTTVNEIENRNIGGYQPPSDAFEDDVPDMFGGDFNADRFSSHAAGNQDDNEVEDDTIDDEFEEGDDQPLSLDDLSISPEKKAKEVKLFARRGAHVSMHEKTFVRPGTPQVISSEDLYNSTSSFAPDFDLELQEYNANEFWKPNLIDIDDLEELD